MNAEPEIRPHALHDGDVSLEGVLAVPRDRCQPLPGVLLIHEFTGLGRHVTEEAAALAREGYAVLCADMYGPDARPRDREEALAISRSFRADRARMRERAAVNLAALAALSFVDPSRLFAAGYSFGGCAALELCRHDPLFVPGAPFRLRAAASFYGYLDAPLPCAPGLSRPPMLVLLGARDKVVPLSDAPAFAGEMEAAGAAYRMVVYSGAGHAFSNPYAPDLPDEGAGYSQKTAALAFEEMLAHFAEHGGVPRPAK